MRIVGRIGSTLAGAVAVVGAGWVALDYAAWSYKPGGLAQDDFWDRCRGSARLRELDPGRHESVVWSEENEQGVCEDILGYCMVSKQDDGSMFGDAWPEHQVRRTALNPSNCSYFGQLFADAPPFRKVN